MRSHRVKTERLERQLVESGHGYGHAGGQVRCEQFDGSGHFAPIDARERWSAVFFEFLESVE
jgi:hypothetical protein